MRKIDDIERVRASFEIAQRRADRVVRFFYAHLFDSDPRLRGMFPAEMREQHDRLFAALAQIVTHLDDPALQAQLEALGRDHRKFGVCTADYDTVGHSLIAAMRMGCVSAWDDATEAAWWAVYGRAARTMLHGAAASIREREPAWWDATVVEQSLHNGRTAVLRILPDQPYPYRAGQYATLECPQVPRVWRPYSLARAPRADGLLEFHVARVRGGSLSTMLCDHVRAGDRLRLGAASGTATAPGADGAPVTLIAAGTGWAPVKAVLEDLLRARAPGPPRRIRLDVLARTPDDLYDGATIDALASGHPHLEVAVWTARAAEGASTLTRRFHEALRRRDDWADGHVYLAGPTPFAAELRDLLPRWGADPARLIHDPFARRGGASGATRTAPAEYFLADRSVSWIDPAARAPAATGPEPETEPVTEPEAETEPGPSDHGDEQPDGSRTPESSQPAEDEAEGEPEGEPEGEARCATSTVTKSPFTSTR
ncbi:flavohemoprotein [Streptomyces sp. RKND-216]|uniref:globin domain-containing protein n=1 Tax=Streptomyces sp. RKND-216 TaxID=2562581 RepID=UPI00109DA10B|nr:globin domain-containing protein [Streptomyces sp. RKND-216]THA25840.1 flavohemoprotein [Streptomyces sp. RKND-216]